MATISSICSRVSSGGTPKSNESSYYGGNIPWLNTKEIDFNFIESTEKTITESGLNNSSAKWVEAPSVIVAMYGATAGKVAISKIRLTTNQACCNLNIDPIKADYRFVYYALKSDYIRLSSMANGGAQQNLNAQQIKDFEIPDFSRSDQKKIADILSSLDEKIETNRRINARLEELAQAIFKSWFIDFEPFGGQMPNDWEQTTIGSLNLEIIDFVANGSFASLKENVTLYDKPEFAYFIRNTDLKVNSFPIFVDEHSYNFLFKSRLFGGEIIISNVGDVGSVFLCPSLDRPMTLGNNIIMVRPKKDNLTSYLYLFFRSYLGQHLIDGITGGSAQPKFNKTDFKRSLIILPKYDVLTKCEHILRPLLQEIEHLKLESARLAALRDTLLPKLMSGELIPE